MMAAGKESAGKLKRALGLLAVAVILVLMIDKLAYEVQFKAVGGNIADPGYLESKQAEKSAQAMISQPTLTCNYYIDADFKRSLKAAVPAEGDNRRIVGGIVPHHLLADTMISSFFATVSEAEPELVFIVGPNHKRLGNSKIHTGSWDWQTPLGLLDTDGAAVSRLVKKCPAGENFKLLEVEHSITSLAPYVKYYMPEASIVPLVLHGNLGLEGSKELARSIIEIAGDRNWIIIGSIDFSHYLTPKEADRMDAITLEAIRNADLKAISRMDNDNMDSPPSLMTVLEAVGSRGEYDMKVTGHSNSSEVTGIYSDDTTSYFTILFYGK